MANLERLQNCIVALRDANPEHFSMTHVADCGTPSCVLGHYAARRDLQDEFRLTPQSNWMLDANGDEPNYDDPSVCDHFDLTEKEAAELFGSHGCNDARTPQEAIAYIEAFIKDEE
jgi:hypothetical protein